MTRAGGLPRVVDGPAAVETHVHCRATDEDKGAHKLGALTVLQMRHTGGRCRVACPCSTMRGASPSPTPPQAKRVPPRLQADAPARPPTQGVELRSTTPL
ncbi:MAG: hypothetical protein WDW36_000086 [Sanguina aurantia]